MKNKIVRNLIGNRKNGTAGNKRSYRIRAMAAALCIALALGQAGTAICAQASGKGASERLMAAANSASGQGTKGAGAGKAKEAGKDGLRLSKEETVYVLAGADGSAQKIIVSDWIQNAPGMDTVKDLSELKEVEAVKDELSYTEGSSNERVWNAQGGDIYYQGNIEKELPVSVKVSYLLDGKKVSPQELAGKSGKVTIRFDYVNKQYQEVEIDGKKIRMNVPFAMMTGMILDNEVFANVEVVNGRLVNDGDRTVVVGLAFPGLQESLDLDTEKVEIPDYVEITADAKNFELGMTVTLASNEVFNGIQLDKDEVLEELDGSIKELTDACDQLIDGSSQLYEGLCTLLDKSGELIKGIDQLASGSAELRDGAGSLDEGASKLRDGVSRLQNGLGTLTSKNGELTGGARQVFESLLSAARTQLAAAGLDASGMTVENYAEVLNQVIASLDKDAVYQQALNQVTSAVEENRSFIEAQVTEAVRAEVLGQVSAAAEEQVRSLVTPKVRAVVYAQVIQAATGMDTDAYEEAVAAGTLGADVQAAVEAALEEQMASDGVKAQIDANVSAQMASDEVKAQIDANTKAQMSSESLKQTIAANTELQVQKAIAENMAGEEVQGKLSAASEGARSVIALKSSLDSYNAFYLGLQAYTAGVAEAASGAGSLSVGIDELKGGTNKLYEGASQLCDGIWTMKNSAPALTEGITQLRDGAQELMEGMTRFDEEGISKLAEAVDGDLEGLMDRLSALFDASKNYKSFSGIDKEMDGSVKFIYRTDAIESEE